MFEERKKTAKSCNIAPWFVAYCRNFIANEIADKHRNLVKGKQKL